MKARNHSLPVCIYALHEPEDENDVRYIGASTKPRQRYNSHLSEARTYGLSLRARWISSVLARGKRPGLKILTVTDSAHQDLVEAQYACMYHAKGARLVNVLTSLPGYWQWQRVAQEAQEAQVA
jgi:hypothetical protein